MDTDQTILVSGTPVGVFSTLQREARRGRIFSTRLSPTVLVVDPATGQLVPDTSIGRDILVPRVVTFPLTPLAVPRNVFVLPGGPLVAASGTAEVRVDGRETARVTARVTGLGPLPPGMVLTLWLLLDLVVPTDVSPADLALLPRRADGVNQPGRVFTVDGLPSTVGRAEVPVWNTVTVAIRVGTPQLAGDGTATLQVALTPEVNIAVDPRLLLGPQFAAVTGPAVPSGLAAGILTDTFMRPATVLPQLPLAAFPQRLAAVAQAAVARFDLDGDGIVSTADATASATPGLFLSPAQFNRAALTLEPVVRTSPLLLPTDQNVVLVCLEPGTATAVR